MASPFGHAYTVPLTLPASMLSLSSGRVRCPLRGARRLTGMLPSGLPAAVARTAHASVGAALTAAGKLAGGSVRGTV